MKKKKKRNIILLGILLIAIILTISVSFALWQVTLKQTEQNEITSSCFKIEFKEKNSITLTNAYPVTDEEASGFIPYEFSIENTCGTATAYQVNLEILNTTTLENLGYMKVMLDDSMSILSSNKEETKTLDNANKSYKLQTGYIDENEKKEFELRLWLDENTPASEEFMEKLFESKITVITSYQEYIDKEAPIANATITKEGDNIVIDASTSADDHEIKYYYYSLDGENFTKTTEPTYTELDEGVIYGIANMTIQSVESIDAYVRVEDGFGNQSEVKKVSLKRNASLLYDGTVDNNLRYVGANPNNYVTFNNELWRIVGVMNNIDDGTGKKESRIKIVRNAPIGSYSWANTISSVSGRNDWTQADIMKLMNPGYDSEATNGSLYWNRGSGQCYTEQGKTSNCNFTSTGLTTEAKKYIEEAVWNIAGNTTSGNWASNPKTYYSFERGSTVSIGPSTWTGIVGLLYPSDYGFATTGGSEADRETCLNRVMSNWNAVPTDCGDNDWLKESYNYVFMTPRTRGNNGGINNQNQTIMLYSTGALNVSYTPSARNIKPTTYLKSNVKITGGDGSTAHPFELSIAE